MLYLYRTKVTITRGEIHKNVRHSWAISPTNSLIHTYRTETIWLKHWIYVGFVCVLFMLLKLYLYLHLPHYTMTTYQCIRICTVVPAIYKQERITVHKIFVRFNIFYFHSKHFRKCFFKATSFRNLDEMSIKQWKCICRDTRVYTE